MHKVGAFALIMSVMLGWPATTSADGLFGKARALSQQNASQAATTLSQQGWAAYNQKNYDKSERLFKRSIAVRTDLFGAYHPTTAHAINGLGWSYWGKRQYAKSELYHTKVLEIFKASQGENHRYTANAMYSLAESYKLQERYEEAQVFHKRALAVREKLLGESHETANSLLMLAEVYRYQGDYKRAEPLMIRNLEMRKKLHGEDHAMTAQAQTALARLYHHQGRYRKAVPLFKKSITIRNTKTKDITKHDPTPVHDLAGVLHDLGQYEEAQRLYKEALEIKEAIWSNDHPYTLTTLNGLASLYQSQGRYKEAEQLFQQALVMREKKHGAEHTMVASSLRRLAELYRLQERYEEAEPLQMRALAIQKKKKHKNQHFIAIYTRGLARLYLDQGKHKEAATKFAQALEIYRTSVGEEHPDTGAAFYELAILQGIQGQQNAAVKSAQRSLDIRRRVLSEEHPDVARSLSQLGHLAKSNGRIDEAVMYLKQATQLEEQHLAVNLSTGSERQKRAYMNLLDSSTRAALNLHLGFAPEHAQAGKLALTVVLQRKGRVLDALTEELKALRQRLGPEEKDLLDKLEEVRAQVATLTLAGPGRQPLKIHLERLKQAHVELETLETRLAGASKAFRAQHRPITLKAVQQELPKNGALVEFVLFHQTQNSKAPKGQARYGVYVLNKNGALRWTDLGEREHIDAMVAKFREKLLFCLQSTTASSPQCAATHGNRMNLEEVLRIGQTLHAKVWAPVETLLKELDISGPLVLAPEGSLHTLPFEALVDTKETFVLEHQILSYVTTGRDLVRLAAIEPSKHPPIVIANPNYDMTSPKNARQNERLSSSMSKSGWGPLPGTDEEGKKVSHLLGAALHKKDKATESTFKALKAPGLLHVATHGFFLKDIPSDNTVGSRGVKMGSPVDHLNEAEALVQGENTLLRSGLVLAGVNKSGDGQDDGVLTALELASVDLWGTQLVVLSACQTGLGQIKTGQGVYGLRRSLVLAGALSQVMSLWQADDKATQMLMHSYYQSLTEGSSRGQSLRQARLKMLHGEHQHPYFWASFVPVGLWSPLDGLSFHPASTQEQPTRTDPAPPHKTDVGCTQPKTQAPTSGDIIALIFMWCVGCSLVVRRH